jgi:hypothetical protein
MIQLPDGSQVTRAQYEKIAAAAAADEDVEKF